MNAKKVLKDITESVIFLTVLSMVLIPLHPAIASQPTVSDSSGNAQTYGDAEELAYKIVPTIEDSRGNALQIWLDSYLEPKEGPLNYLYPYHHKAAIIYIITVKQSPGDTVNHNSWGLKDGSSSHHTITVTLDNPESGNSPVSMNENAIPDGVVEEDYEGTVNYGFAITWGESAQILGTGAHLDVNTYVSWSIPVYGYTYYPGYSTSTKFIALGDVNSPNWWDNRPYFVARKYTASVAAEYPYLDLQSQSIHLSVVGRFHQWVTFGSDSTLSYSYRWEVIHRGQEIPI